MRKVTILIALVLAAAVGLAAQQTNFSGKWVLDPAKSTMPQMGGGGQGRGGQGRGGPGGGGQEMTIAQTATELTIERGPGKTAYKLDGTETVNQTPRGESKSTAKWDGGKLVIKTTQSFEGPNGPMTMESTATYSLSADGKALTVDQVRASQRGEMKSTMVYNKQ